MQHHRAASRSVATTRTGTGCAATIVLVTGGYLVMSGAAVGKSNEGGWFTQVWTQVWPASWGNSTEEQAGASSKKKAADESWFAQLMWPPSWFDPAEDDTQYGRASSRKKKTDDAAAPAANARGSADRKGELFRSGPQYQNSYDAKAQVDVYGAKTAVDPPRPFELGRQQYTPGLYPESGTLLGDLNPLLPGLSIYGDWRTAAAYNSNAGKDIAQIATRLNIDVDFKFTATERIHAFFTPLQNNAKFTRFEFGTGAGNGKFNGEFDANPQALFFEGDLGSIYSGVSGKEAGFDLPVTAGLFPLFLQNGIWANDQILGGAVSLTAKNSRRLGLANYDVTLFAAFDNIDNAGILGADNRRANLFGATTFIDAFGGFIEAGYGLIEGVENQVLPGVVDNRVAGQKTHFLAAAYSRRYGDVLSNTTRVFGNFGDGKNDDGVLLISENSLISGLPSTLIPYANFFVGYGNPQPLVDTNKAGLLKNVGINFETDALTGFPKLNDTGSNAWGGAVGVQYLFNLDQQLVFEVGTVQPFGTPIAGVGAAKPQYGFGTRYQIPIDRAWLFRADATYQIIEGGNDNFGVRTELRRKF